MRKDLHEQNRRSWNRATVAHNSHKGDQAARLRAGGSTLFPEELELLGDLSGLRLVHLLCNSGQDTLSLAARGAEVTGVDISDEAIAFARRLAADSGVPGRFERADVYDWLAAAPPASFDVAYLSYGAVPWLSDLAGWARGVAALLAPGGRLVVMEFHPAVYLVDERDGRMVWGPTRGGGGAPQPCDVGIGDYVADSGAGLGAIEPGVVGFTNPEPCCEFEWSVVDLVEAVARAGLRVETVREWAWSNGCKFFPSMVDRGGGRWGLSDQAPPLPLMLGLVARA